MQKDETIGWCYPRKDLSLFFILALTCILLFLTAHSCTSEKTSPKEVSSFSKNQEIKPVNQNQIEPGMDTLAILHSRIITGDGVHVIEDGCVIIEGGLIAAVGKYDEVSIPEGMNTLEAGGMTVLPGLIDAHFHLDQLDSLPTVFLSRGITSLRDPGAWIEAYDGERASQRPLPRLFLTGPHLDMYPPAYPKNSFVLRDPREAEAAVHQFADAGASAIKIYFRSSLEIIQTICSTAHKRGLPVTAHLEITDIYSAINAGVDGIEHITSLATSLIPLPQAEAYKQAILQNNNARRLGRYSMWEQIDPEGPKAVRLSEFLAEKNTFVCPTLGAFEYRPEPDLTDTLRWKAFQNMLQYTKKLKDVGVNIVVGSHSWVRYSKYGWAYHHEMELLQALGMTPQEIIRAATLDNARFLGVADKIGTLAPGKVADLILIEGDPLKGIEALRQIRKVMQAGEFLELANL